MKCPVCDYVFRKPDGVFDDVPTEDKHDVFIISDSAGWRRFVVACPKCKILSLGDSEDI